MHKQNFLLTLFLIVLSPLIAQNQDSIKNNNVETLKKEIQSVETTDKQAVFELQSEVKELETKLKNLEKIGKTNVDTLIKAINEKERKISELEFLKLKDQFRYCGIALKEMEKGVILVNFMQRLLLTTNEVQSIYNLWSDDDVRNGWDKCSDALNIIGPISAGGLIAFGDNINENNIKLGVGISISGIAMGQALKMTLGNETSKKREFIQVSRNIYDELVIINVKINEYIKNNSALETDIKNVRIAFDNYNSRLTTDSINSTPTKEVLAQTISIMDKYEIVLTQIPIYLYSLKGLLETYAFKEYKVDDKKSPLRPTISILNGKITQLEAEYVSKVLPLLTVGVDIKAKIMGF